MTGAPIINTAEAAAVKAKRAPTCVQLATIPPPTEADLPCALAISATATHVLVASFHTIR